MQRIERRLPVKAVTFLGDKLTERFHLFVGAFCKALPRHAQSGHFQRRDRCVVDPVGVSHLFQRLLSGAHLPPLLRLFAVFEIIQHVDVDINHVQPAPG
ncbi:hypothetical protein D3C76_1277130 [compost metagenome]